MIEQEPRQAPRLRLLFWSLVALTFCSALDQTIVSTGLPTIVAELGDVHAMSWILVSYVCAMTIAMPVAGRLGDLHGRRRLFLGCVVVYLLGALLCGLTQEVWHLLAARFLQGLGGGGVTVLSQAVVGDALSPRDRGRFLGPIGSVFGVATVIAPIAGGAVTDALGWRWIFWVSLPVGVAGLILAAIAVPRVRHPRQGERFDHAGAALVSVFLLGVVAGVAVAGAGGSRAVWIPLLAAAGTAFAAALVWESRAPHPLLPLRMFANRTVAISSTLAFIVGAGLFGLIGYLPAYLQATLGLSASGAGVMMLPLIAGLMGAGTFAGVRMSRHGRYRRFPVIGCLLAAGGMTALALAGVSSPPVVCAVVAVIGIGAGCFMQVLTVAVQNAVGSRALGTGTAVVALVREMGVTLGALVVGSLLASRLVAEFGSAAPVLAPDGAPARAAEVATGYATAMAPILIGIGLLFAVGAVIARLLPDDRLRPSATGTARAGRSSARSDPSLNAPVE
ncbi:EmrB/QacA subfamily drug resistance transporter [Thermocatellispora tengchongensis]|uniref:EmrB/QacA subfamily drug resistance transporter n=1 Tax=Thermocatellispora tengchongensis TaxID=1073253 RepID=A0A840PL12_9ACTN|nr:MFS transporter [Thermocatellispora tengchongensis]MBB5138481.1 EmrB/QacA subfamily drug resistance transporter [Thermocatellispora tengchongensis]